MHFSTAPSLFLGLGARVLLDKFTGSGEPSTTSTIVMGVWEGVGLYYAYTRHQDIALVAALGVVAHVVFDFVLSSDAQKSLCICLGVGIGIVCTELLSQVFDGDSPEPTPSSSRVRESSSRHRPRQYSIQHHETDGQSSQGARDMAFHQRITDITSVDSNSDLIRMQQAMSPLEKEAAVLRARASLADSERRRYKEEKKWAAEAGNFARVEQMRWQIKKYTALMQSFTRQADEIVVEAARRKAANPEREPEIRLDANGNPSLPRRRKISQSRNVTYRLCAS